MFGYIAADPSQLSQEEIARYSGCYCGLCRRLKQKYGLSGRMTLTYDMVFLVLLLSSLYEPEETTARAQCPVHPIRKRAFWENRYTDYAADLNLLLARWNCLDDWQDDQKLTGLCMTKLLQTPCENIEKQYPRQTAAVSENLQLLHQYEDGPLVSADRAADCFGKIMGELFVVSENDHWAPTLRALGEGLGRFIYIMDACIDYHGDEKHHRPNPLRSLSGSKRTREDDHDLLTMLLGDCTTAFERLPLEQDLALLRNILYAGVWQKYTQAFYRRRKGRKCEEKEGDGVT